MIAEQSSPSFLAFADPWLIASPMEAAGIRDALVTQLPLPAIVTP